MRTWTLEDAVVVEPPMVCGEPVEVIELGPMLDLLERLNRGIYALANGGSVDGATLNAVNEVLVAHGRLDG